VTGPSKPTRGERGRPTRAGQASREARFLEILSSLFAGFEPDTVFGGVFSVDMSELLVVFGTIFISLAAMVVFGNWWSR
jgi:hypothetical protein